MNKFTTVLMVTAMLGAGMIMAQSVNIAPTRPAGSNQSALDKSVQQADSTAVQCRLSDGTKLKSCDGKGSGGKIQNRRHRRNAVGKGNRQRQCDGNGQTAVKTQKNRSVSRNGSGLKLRKRDGSCGNASCSVDISVLPAMKK